MDRGGTKSDGVELMFYMESGLIECLSALCVVVVSQ